MTNPLFPFAEDEEKSRLEQEIEQAMWMDDTEEMECEEDEDV